ncbi:MFS transporter [Dehalobacter sp. DCM]|uniref:MFS transporter n=1 Tax=Dehalobacter sp. DCM TaxID=2907827 RepID=UPI003081EC86|nr:MFS transporter [Dehalobacter sp. DCM]
METTATGEKKYGFWPKFAVISLICIQFTQAFAAPALASIQASFPNVDPTIVQQIIALPTMLMVVSSIFCGRLCAAIGYRKSAYIAIVLALLGGVMPAIMHSSIGIILFWRAVFGLGYGLVFALCISSINVLWSGKEQKMMIGLETFIGAACAMGYSYLSGVLAGINWVYVFWSYLIVVPFAIVIIAFLPEPPKEKLAVPLVKEDKVKGGFGNFYWMFIILAAISVIFTAAFMNNVAMVIMGNGIGQPHDIGFAMTFFSLLFSIGGLLYVPLRKVIGRFMIPVLLVIFGIDTIMMTRTLNLSTFVALTAIYGALFSLLNCEYNVLSGTTVKSRARIGDGVSLYIAGQGVGQFVGPFVCAGLAGLLGFTGPNYQLLVSGPVMLAAGIVLCIIVAIKKGDPTVAKYVEDQKSAAAK